MSLSCVYRLHHNHQIQIYRINSNLFFVFVSECRERDESPWYDSGLIPRIRENYAGRPRSLQSTSNFQSFFSTRSMQFNTKRTGYNTQATRTEQRCYHDKFLFQVSDLQGSG